MNIIKRIITYSIWTAIALLLGVSYMRIVLGPNDVPTKGLWNLLHIFYDYGLLYVGLIIGSIVALLFILLDVFYLKKKLENNSKRIVIRFMILIAIAIIVVILHYILEKVIDVI